MSKPEMNCGGEYPEWEFISKPEGVTISEKPEICKDCEFFMACFMNRSSEILGMPTNMSVEDMTRMVNIQRLMEQGADDEVIASYIRSMTETK